MTPTSDRRRLRRNIVSKLVSIMAVSEQLWLPFDTANAPHVHCFARLSGFKVQTRTVYRGGIKGIRIKRVA